jgi:hypothetical protein
MLAGEFTTIGSQCGVVGGLFRDDRVHIIPEGVNPLLAR